MRTHLCEAIAHSRYQGGFSLFGNLQSVSSRLAEPQCLNPITGGQRRELLIAMCAARVPASSIAAALFTNRFELGSLAREYGLVLNTNPVHVGHTGRPWSYSEIALLSRKWLAGEKMTIICAALGRTESSVRQKKVALALPSRTQGVLWSDTETAYLKMALQLGIAEEEIEGHLQRSSASVLGRVRRLGWQHLARDASIQKNLLVIPEDESIVLSWEQARNLPMEGRNKRSWRVRNSPTNLIVRCNKKSGHLHWTVAARDEIALRHFAGQSPEAIAEDFQITRSAVLSQAWWLGLPRRDPKDLRPDFVPALAAITEARMGYQRVECRQKKGFFFWTETGRNRKWLSRKADKSASEQ